MRVGIRIKRAGDCVAGIAAKRRSRTSEHPLPKKGLFAIIERLCLVLGGQFGEGISFTLNCVDFNG